MLQRLKKKMKEQKGFTLIELLAVIVILGIIAAIAIPSITHIIEKSKGDAIRADAKLILNAAKIYQTDVGMAEGATITRAELEPNYIDNISTFPTTAVASDGHYTVTLSATDKKLHITGTGTKGSVVLHFTDDTLQDVDTVTN